MKLKALALLALLALVPFTGAAQNPPIYTPGGGGGGGSFNNVFTVDVDAQNHDIHNLLRLRLKNGSFYDELIAGTLTGNHVITFPDSTGTAALLADITASNLSGTLPVSKGGTGASSLTASRALATNGSSILTVSTATAAELDYLAGVTSAIQTQINGKMPATGAQTITAQITNSTGFYQGDLRVPEVGGDNANYAGFSLGATAANVIFGIPVDVASGSFVVGTTNTQTLQKKTIDGGSGAATRSATGNILSVRRSSNCAGVTDGFVGEHCMDSGTPFAEWKCTTSTCNAAGWVAVGGGGSGAGDVISNGAAVSGNVAVFDGDAEHIKDSGGTFNTYTEGPGTPTSCAQTGETYRQTDVDPSVMMVCQTAGTPGVWVQVMTTPLLPTGPPTNSMLILDDTGTYFAWVAKKLIDTAGYLDPAWGFNLEALASGWLGGPMAACRTGIIKGGGWNGLTTPAQRKWDWTCGNYNWSAEIGGITGSTASYNTPTTAGGNAELIDCTGDGAGTFRDFPAQSLAATALRSVCLRAGEVIRINAMADAMLAWDNTKRGGKVYFPANYIYVDRGCGDRANGAGFTGNGCPVLRPPHDGFRTRKLNAAAGIEFVGEGMSPTSPLNTTYGRSIGTWFVDDTGGKESSATQGLDPSDGATAIAKWTFKSGLDLGNTPCVPVSNTNANCNPSSSVLLQMSDGAWGKTIALPNTSDMTDPGAICINAATVGSGAANGTCRLNRRITCTAGGTDVAASSGGCRFSASSGQNEKGPCENDYDAIAYDLTQDLVRVMISAKQQDGGGANTTSDEPSFAVVAATPGTACGTNGKTIALGAPGGTGWTMPQSRILASDASRYMYVLDWANWFNEGGGWRDISFMPNNWYGRDVAGGASGDCLSGGTPASSDDEAACDSAEITGLHSAYRGGFHRIAGWFASGHTTAAGSNYDGSPAGIQGEFEDNLISRTKRLALIDASGWHYKRNLWLGNVVAPSGACFNANFTSQSTFEDEWVVNNTCGSSIYQVAPSKGSTFRSLHIMGNNALYTGFRMDNGVAAASEILFDDIEWVGNQGGMNAFQFFPITGSTINDITIRNQRWYGASPLGGNWGHSFISFNRFGDVAQTGRMKNILIDNVTVQSTTNNDCLVYFDDAADNANIVIDRPQVTITNSSIDAWNGTTGQRAICSHALGSGLAATQTPGSGGCTGATAPWPCCTAANVGASCRPIPAGVNGATAADNVNIWGHRFMPRWQNLKVSGVAVPDFNYTQRAGSGLVCTYTPDQTPGAALQYGPGAVVTINDDKTANDTCDTGISGGTTLLATSGTGTSAARYKAICYCSSADRFWHSLF